MELKRPEASPDEKQAFQKGIEQFLHPDDRDKYPRERMVPEEIAVFTMTLDDVMHDGALDRAAPVGWQFLMDNSGGGLAAWVGTGDVNRQRLSAIQRGDRVREFMDRIRQLPELDRLKNNNSYELRVLKIPGALVEALWLKALTPGVPDALVPVLSPPKELKIMNVYTADEFLRVVQPLARKFLGFEGVV